MRPDLVVEIRFTEWTSDRLLRHPVYLGRRTDKKARDVRREEPVKTDEQAAGVEDGWAVSEEPAGEGRAGEKDLGGPTSSRKTSEVLVIQETTPEVVVSILSDRSIDTSSSARRKTAISCCRMATLCA